MHDGALRDEFEERGYVVVREYLTAQTVESLAGAIAAASQEAAENPLSLGAMRFASNLYRCSPGVREFVSSEVVTQLLTTVGGPNLWLRWDQAVWKMPGAPPFPWHQDNGYTGLASMHLQLWVALTPMHTANGGLLLCPGGHRRELAHRHVGNHVEVDVPGPTVSISADPGDVVLFSSFLPHATTPNLSQESRLAYVAEYLPLSVDDPSVAPPHLVVAEHGRAVARWTEEPRGD